MINAATVTYQVGMHERYAICRIETWKSENNCVSVLQEIAALVDEFELLISTKEALHSESGNYTVQLEIQDLFSANEAIVAFKAQYLQQMKAQLRLEDVIVPPVVVSAAPKEPDLQQKIQHYEQAIDRTEELRLQALFSGDSAALAECERNKKRFQESLEQTLNEL